MMGMQEMMYGLVDIMLKDLQVLPVLDLALRSKAEGYTKGRAGDSTSTKGGGLISNIWEGRKTDGDAKSLHKWGHSYTHPIESTRCQATPRVQGQARGS